MKPISDNAAVVLDIIRSNAGRIWTARDVWELLPVQFRQNAAIHPLLSELERAGFAKWVRNDFTMGWRLDV